VQVSWRRNLAVLTVVQLLSTAGFSLVFPFLALYVREVGIATSGSIEFWAGLVFSAQAVTMMISAPIWGAVADARGRKLMLERATIGGAIIMAAMGFVQNAEQLVVLRALQGMITGVVAATNALVAAGTPREHTGMALGTINMARWVGVAGGPLLGGLLGEAFGFRESFWITGTLLGLAGLGVVFLVQEEFVPKPRAQRTGFWAGYRTIIRAPGMSGLYTLTMLRSMGATLITPMLALFVLSLNNGREAGTAALTGVAIGAAALTSAISAVYLGRLGDRIGHSRVLLASALAAAVLSLPQMFVTAPWQLILFQALAGVATGGLIPATAALMNLWAPQGSQGATYGLENSVQAAGRTVAPLLAALIASSVGYRGVFAGTALVYVAIALLAVAIVRAATARHALVLGEPDVATVE
jgi:DHA1 family multidrug resistance protein-like MFS transporter